MPIVAVGVRGPESDQETRGKRTGECELTMLHGATVSTRTGTSKLMVTGVGGLEDRLEIPLVR